MRLVQGTIISNVKKIYEFPGTTRLHETDHSNEEKGAYSKQHETESSMQDKNQHLWAGIDQPEKKMGTHIKAGARETNLNISAE